MLQISEIYKSVQGESMFAGLPCTFVRLTGCPLRCKWCDTAYAFQGGESLSIENVLQKIDALKCNLVEITGGEPLAQKECIELINKLHEFNYKVLIETSGSEDISRVDCRTHIIMDLKCPDSKMSEQNLYANINFLKKSDEIKFVISSQNDFNWAKDIILEYSLENVCNLLFSPAWGHTKESDLVSWLLNSGIKARLNLQLHKYIWGPRAKGV